jgi:apolipoprotein N-acyltransferase
VAWVALAPLLVALAQARSAAHGFRLGYLTGAVSALGLVYWTSYVVVQYGGLSHPVGIGVMLLLCLALALFPSLFGWTVARWSRAYGTTALLLSPVAWVGMEILRGHTLFNFSWCLLGYSQQQNLAVLQLARHVAVYGVSFVVASTSATLAYLVLERRSAARWAAGCVAAAFLALVWIHGEWWLTRTVPTTGQVRVGLVQASIAQEDKWEPAEAWNNVLAHFALTRTAAARGARLVVWPESALPYVFDRQPTVARELRTLAGQNGVHLLFGNDDREARDGQRDRIYVGAKMLDPEGRLTLRYHKMRLVPFGEYVPVESVFTLGGRVSARLVQQVGSFTPGTEFAVGEVDGHRVGAFICYEAIFADHVRGFARAGAELLVNITNDAWYGRTSAPYQHFAMAVFRAVESERYLVRAANTGITAVVDPRGRVLESTALFERTVLVRDVPFVATSTFYVRHGDVFAWGCLVAAAALTAAGRHVKVGRD